MVSNYLPPYKPHTILSPEDPRNINPVLFPWRRADSEGVLCDGYMEMRYKLQKALDDSREVIKSTNQSFAEVFGRDHGGMLWHYRTEDADLILTGMGSVANEATAAVDTLREEGFKVGVIGIRVFRPFPKAEIRDAFKRAKTLIVFEKAISYGNEGALCGELKAAFYGTDIRMPIHNYVVGLGGRDVKAREITEAVRASVDAIATGDTEPKPIWLNCFTE
jgi:pyruvate/2-oxoacid:ferredoxin oxidoreductase alpha subunit